MKVIRRDPGYVKVSIRSPHRSEGRLKRLLVERQFDRFQSAPPTEVRGDYNEHLSIAVRREVSIRSPHRSEGRPHGYVVVTVNGKVSIRSPHRSEGRRKW